MRSARAEEYFKNALRGFWKDRKGGTCAFMGDKEDKNARKQRKRELRNIKRKEIEEEISLYGEKILDSEEMHDAFREKHHNLSTVGDHTLRVARASLAICHALNKVKISTDIPAVVTGSLCHDLGILGHEEKYGSTYECSKQHPLDSVEIARKLVDDLPEKTPNIISSHMWPVIGSKAPKSLEAAIVSTADKIATFEDYIEGYKERRPALKKTVKYLINKKKE